MGKKLFLALIFPVLLSAGCTHKNQEQADAVSAVTARRGPPVPTLLKRYMPEAMNDGMVKIAVLINQKTEDNSRQFIEGCVSEGRSLGFTVDTFTSGGDENRCGEIAAGIASAGYDGLIFSNGFARGTFDASDDSIADSSYHILKPVADTGIPIVTFEALPYRNGRSIPNLITTFQDDYQLARLSLETLLSSSAGKEGVPLRVIRAGCDPGITFLDRRAWEFALLADKGTIKEAAFVKLNNLNNPHSAAWEALAAILPHFPPGSVDALWVPWNEFAGGCAEALSAAGRDDITMVSIGISNDDIHRMQRHARIWIANAAVDPKLEGTVNMRILAAALAGESLNNRFSFSPQLIKTADLTPAVNISNISVILPHWGDGKGLFDNYQWMSDLKAGGEKYLRIPPAAAP